MYVYFDSGSYNGHGIKGFLIFDTNVQKVVMSGKYYGAGLTNYKAGSFSVRNALDYLTKLVLYRSSLQFSFRVFRDS